MRKRSGYLIAVGMLLLICLGVYETLLRFPDPSDFRDGMRWETDWYVVSESRGEQRLYRMDAQGILLGEAKAHKGEKLVSMGITGDQKKLMCLSSYIENKREYYRLRIYGRKLQLLGEFDRQQLEGDVAGRLFSEGGKVTVTSVGAGQKTAVVYELDTEKKGASFREAETVSAGEERFFLEAVKEGETFYARYDNGETVSVRGSSQKEGEPFPAMNEKELPDTSLSFGGAAQLLRSEGDSVLLGVLLKGMAIGALLFLIYGALGKTSYRLQRFAVWELVFLGMAASLLGVCAGAMERQDEAFIKKQAESRLKAVREQLEPYTEIAGPSDEYAGTEGYRRAFEAMLTTKQAKSWEGRVLSFGLIKKSGDGYQVVLSDSLPAGSPYQGSEKVREALSIAVGKDKPGVVVLDRKEGYRIYGAAPGGKEIAGNCLWVVELAAERSPANERVLCSVRMAAGIIFAAGTLIMLCLLYAEGNQMRRLAKAFQEASQGAYQKKEITSRLNNEMELLWKGLGDYAKGVERIRYRQSSQQKLYARFVPKAAGTLFREWTPEKLSAGEYVSGNGIVGCVRIQGDSDAGKEQMMAVKNQITDLFLQYQEENAVFIPQSGNLDEMWGVFLKDVEDAVHTSVRLFGSLEERQTGWEMTLLLHQSEYTYGITGNTEQVIPYFSVDTGDELLHYARKLRELGVRIAVTEQVMGTFEDLLSLRCVGYIEIGGTNRNLYEVLEAYPGAMRRSIEAQRGKFAKALELYYGSDFYLARNIFAEILRECPKDQVAKWYLFACEKRLGSEGAFETGYGLFVED